MKIRLTMFLWSCADEVEYFWFWRHSNRLLVDASITKVQLQIHHKISGKRHVIPLNGVYANLRLHERPFLLLPTLEVDDLGQ